MVGAAGFELATLCSQSRCATRLRYAPTVNILTLKQAILASGDKKVALEMHLSGFYCPLLRREVLCPCISWVERGEKAGRTVNCRG